jgi:HlyD family secretion protein
MPGKKVGLFVFGLTVAGVFAWVVMTQGPLAPVRVTTANIQTGNFSNAVSGTGTLEAKRSYNLAPIMTSRVKAVLVDQGDQVIAGQMLAEMDPVDLDEKLTGATRVSEKAVNAILVAEAQLAEADSRANLASATFSRYEELHARGFVSQEMIEAKRYEKNAAAAARDAAGAALAAARQDSARAQADVAGISKLRRQTRLISPVDGVVTDRLVEPGVTVVAGQTVLQVIDPTSLWVRTRIDQKQAGAVIAGQDAEIVLRSQPQSPQTGVVERVNMISDAVTEERIVNVSFRSKQPAGNIGESAEVTIKLQGMDKVRSIPSAAVKHVDQHDGVWLLRNGLAQFQPVRTGMRTLVGRTQILEGISDDDEVIVYSQQPMRAGLKVRVVPELVRGNP